MTDTVVITVCVSTDKVGSKCSTDLEFDRAEWDEMDETQRDEVCREAMFEMIEWYWKDKND